MKHNSGKFFIIIVKKFYLHGRYKRLLLVARWLNVNQESVSDFLMVEYCGNILLGKDNSWYYWIDGVLEDMKDWVWSGDAWKRFEEQKYWIILGMLKNDSRWSFKCIFLIKATYPPDQIKKFINFDKIPPKYQDWPHKNLRNSIHPIIHPKTTLSFLFTKP